MLFEILVGIAAIAVIIILIKFFKAVYKYQNIVFPLIYVSGTVIAEHFFCGTLTYIPIGITLWILGIIAVKGLHADPERLIKFNLILVIVAIISMFFENKYIAPLFVLAYICIRVLSGTSAIDRQVRNLFKEKGFISIETLNGAIDKKVKSCWIKSKNGLSLLNYAWQQYCGLADNAINNIIRNATAKQSRIVLFTELPNASAYLNSPKATHRSYGDYIQEDQKIWNDGFISQKAYENMWNTTEQAVTAVVPNIDCKDTEQILRLCGDPISSFVPTEWNRGNAYKCAVFDANLTPFVENGTLSKIPPVKENAMPIYEAKPPVGSPPNPMQPPNQEGGVISLADDEEEEE